MTKKFCILFAGVPGSSKSPIAHHLGWNLGLPVFNNDTLRTEVKEDTLSYDIPEYERRRDERSDKLMASGVSYIYDASVDRAWETHAKRLEKFGYESFIISMDLSEGLIRTLYTAKEYMQFEFLEQWLGEHEEFLKKYGDLVDLHITDEQFSDRLALSLRAVKEWIA